MRPTFRGVAAVLVVVLAVAAAACADDGPPGALEDLLEIMPADAAARGLFYTHLEEDAGFASVLPLGGAGDLLGVDPAALTDVLETGGAPLSVLAGDVDAERVTEAVQAHGYRVEEAGEWATFARAGEAAGALAAAVPAGAVRDGMLVLGEAAEVDAALAGTAPAAAAPGVAAVAAGLGDATAAALLTAPDEIVARAEADGGVAEALARADARGDLPAWDAAALAWQPAGDDADGAVLLAYEGAVDGHEAARAIVLRAATAPVLGDGRRGTAELFERGAPRWDAETGIVRLPIRWRDVAPSDLRRDVDTGALLFLAPTPDATLQ